MGGKGCGWVGGAGGVIMSEYHTVCSNSTLQMVLNLSKIQKLANDDLPYVVCKCG